jgi:hypothetical protein
MMLLIIGLIFLIYFFSYETENMTNLTDNETDKVKQLLNYLQTTDNSFSDYVKYLLSIKNTNLSLIDSEVFSTFKTLKKLKALTVQSIIDEMKLT